MAVEYWKTLKYSRKHYYEMSYEEINWSEVREM